MRMGSTPYTEDNKFICKTTGLEVVEARISREIEEKLEAWEDCARSLAKAVKSLGELNEQQLKALARYEKTMETAGSWT
jgi:hypothetical protein